MYYILGNVFLKVFSDQLLKNGFIFIFMQYNQKICININDYVIDVKLM